MSKAASARSASAKSGAEDPTTSRAPRGVTALGEFIKSQRRIADLSQRELARLADLSDAYLSQLERGLHEPSVRVLNGLSQALNVPADKLLAYLGRSDTESAERSTESAIVTDDRLTDTQKQSMLDVYRAFIAANDVAARK
jgi:transcriptional regulator with XRE-family HTH domain